MSARGRPVGDGWLIGLAPYGYRNVRKDGRGLIEIEQAEAEKNHERIIETAARQFRERGFDGIGVAALM